MFKLRTEYREYIQDCIEDGHTPHSFRAWFETVLWYDWLDEQ